MSRLHDRLSKLEAQGGREEKSRRRQVLIMEDDEYARIPDGTSVLCLSIGPGESYWTRKGEGQGERLPCVCWVDWPEN
jgi:hypothetical protein